MCGIGEKSIPKAYQMRVYKICKNAIVFGVLCFFGGFVALAEGAEEVGVAENAEKAKDAKSSQIAKQFEAIKESDFALDFYVNFFLIKFFKKEHTD